MRTPYFLGLLVISLLAVVGIVSVTQPAGASSGIQVDWTATLGNSGEAEFAYDVTPTNDGGYIAIGINTDVNLEGIYVVKVDMMGNTEWDQTFSLSNYAERGYSVREVPEGGYILIGSANLEGTPDFRPWLIRLDANGNLLWSTENGLTQTVQVDTDIVRGLVRPDASFVIVGGAELYGSDQLWVMQVDPFGNLFSIDYYDPLTPGYGQNNIIWDITATNDGGFAITGGDGYGLGSAFLWKFDANAQSEWSQLYNDEFFRVSFAVTQHSDGGYLMTGCSLANCTNTMAVKTDANGVTEWVQTYDNGGQYAQGRDIVERPDGSYAIAQVRQPAIAALDWESSILETDSAGNLLSTSILPGGAVGTFIYRLNLSWNGTGFAATGYINDSGGVSDIDFYIVKGVFNSTNNVPPVAVADEYSVAMDEVLVVEQPAGLLANDHDSNNDPLFAHALTTPTHGTIELNADGSFTYTPDAGFSGYDSFTYLITDSSHLSTEVNVNLTVGNPPPVYQSFLPALVR